MKVVFVDLSRDFYDKNWVYALAHVPKKLGVDVRYLNVRSVKDVPIVQKEKPDLVLYSAFSVDLPNIIKFDRALKAVHPCRSLLGGPGPTFDWSCHNGTTIDAICVGEGEIALQDYIESGLKEGRNLILQGETKLSRTAPFVELDKLPIPDRDMVYAVDPVLSGMTAKQFMSGRGCPYQCTYCFNHAFNQMFKKSGMVIRKKSVDYLIEEILDLRRKYPLELVSFQDDTFIIDRKWLFEFSQKFPSKVGVPFSCNIRANLIDEDVAKALHEGGCIAASWSIESGNDRLRNEVLLRHMKRDEIMRTGELLHKYGIQQRLANVIGIPGETMEELHETVRMNIAMHPVIATANIFVPFPGLQLTEYALQHGYLLKEKAKDLPRDLWTRSILEFTPELHTYLRKLCSLFLLFIWFPWTFEKKWIRKALFAIPWIVLRITYETIFLITCNRLYRIGGSLRLQWLVFVRYVRWILP